MYLIKTYADSGTDKHTHTHTHTPGIRTSCRQGDVMGVELASSNHNSMTLVWLLNNRF